jgi:hypothetical protein
VKISMSKRDTVYPENYQLGLVWPGETVKRIDTRRGKYYSRNRFILKCVEEHLDEIEARVKNQQKAMEEEEVPLKEND